MAKDNSIENRHRTITACETLYGSFHQHFIEVRNKTVDEVRNEINDLINDEHIQIDFYLYIVSKDDSVIIKEIIV